MRNKLPCSKLKQLFSPPTRFSFVFFFSAMNFYQHSPLWKRVIAWVESSCPSDCGKVWGDVRYCHRIQRPPKQSHNHLGSYSRPRLSLFSKVGYSIFSPYLNVSLNKLVNNSRPCVIRFLYPE